MLLVLLPSLAAAQEVRIRRTEKITGTSAGDLTISAVSPDGKQLLVTSPGFRGLKIMNLRGKSVRNIAEDAGAGYEPRFSPDGKKIFFRSDEFRDFRKYSSLFEYDLEEGTRSLIEPAVRRLGSPVFSAGKLIYNAEGRQKSSDAGEQEMQKGQNNVYVILEDLVPFLYQNGVKKAFKPSGEGNYIWVSLSPDQSKVLYNYNGTGTFVADTAGRILAEMGRLNAPKWINDMLVAGMNDRDDGTTIIASDICCYSLRSKKTVNLTNTEDIIEMYPWPVPGRNRIAFQTSNGELFVMHVRIR